ncbi:hypothetical protein ACEYYH_16865 [Microbacterium trichothecenolyticum]|uniref:hypothetical protein n=1 Tax=Microbacterium trichothecenolyticum TaxID=69370 RepID=UPI0035BE5FE0
MKGRLASAALLGAVLAMLTGCVAPGDAAPPDPVPNPSPGDVDGGAPPPFPGTPPGEPEPVDPHPTPLPPPIGGPGDEGEDIGGGSDDAVVAFQERCAHGVEEWRDALVDYPDRMSVTIDVGANYNAAVDARSEPLPPDEVIEVEDGTATSEAVLVKCTVAARLTPVGQAMEVLDQASETNAGWVLQEFTPSGVIEWSWTVTARHPVDEQLRLELRPAIVLDESAGDLEYAGKNVSSFTTDVHVEASALHHAAYWVDVNRPLIWTIGSAIGAATLAVIVWWRKARSPRKDAPTSERTKGPAPLSRTAARDSRT